MPYNIELEPDAQEHLRMLRARERGTVLHGIEEQLRFTPADETRNRAPLGDPKNGRWKLRIGAFRIFYEVDRSVMRVRVLAVGLKEHNRLLIGGREYRYEDFGG